MIVRAMSFNLRNNLCRTLQTRQDRWSEAFTCILQSLVDTFHIFCRFPKSLAESQCLESIMIAYRCFLIVYLMDRNLPLCNFNCAKKWTTLLMIALAWKHNRSNFAIEITMETNGLHLFAHAHSITTPIHVWFHVMASFSCLFGAKFHTSHTASSTLEFPMNWLLNVNVL